MEFIEYDKSKELSTIKISDEELVDISSVLWYVANTFSKQDKTLLCGVDELRLRDIRSKIDAIFDGIGKTNILRK